MANAYNRYPTWLENVLSNLTGLGKIKVTKYVPPEQNMDIIGIVTGSAQLLHTTDGAALTATTFDVTTRPDSAKILLTNATGAERKIRGVTIRGKPVVKLSGCEGYIHDKYVDYDSIQKNGELKYELGNDMIVTVAQINKLADYAWKNNVTKRHIYSLALPGFQSFFEPGEWYTLTLGIVGTSEYLSSVCECVEVRCSAAAGDVGSTQIGLREMYRNWVFDSNETARSIASGQFGRTPGANTVTVASSTYLGTADYYCDGTADDVQINAAITYVNNLGGGTVHLTEGTFVRSASINCSFSNLTFEGSGDGTILTITGAGYGIDCSINTVSNVAIRNMMLDMTGASSPAIYVNLATNVIITNVSVYNHVEYSIYIDTSCSGVQINNCRIDGNSRNPSESGGIKVLSPQSIIYGNTIKGLKGTFNTIGIYVATADGIVITANSLSTFTSTGIGGTTAGICVNNGSFHTITSNKVESIKNTGAANSARGIYLISPSSVNVGHNMCVNNGTDTGLANTNKCNFYDTGTNTQWAG